MRRLLQSSAVPVVAWTVAVALELSDYENDYLALVFAATGGLWAFAALALWILSSRGRRARSDELRSQQGTRVAAFDAEQLRHECVDTSREILRFLTDRERAAPNAIPDRKSWERDINISTQYMSDTVSLYHERFGPKVV